MTAPIVYKSTDSNAPVLAAVNGSAVNLLNKCLVTGYGDKQGAGWTMPYSNVEGTIACFRNDPSVSTGMFLQVDHVTANAYTVRTRAYELMTSEVDGTFFWGGSVLAPELLRVSSSANSTARPWVLVATEKWFLLVWYGNMTTMPTDPAVIDDIAYGGTIFFGDFDKLYPSDAYNCCCLIGAPSNSSGNGHDSFGRADTFSSTLSLYHRVARSFSGVSGGENAGVVGVPNGNVQYGFGYYYIPPNDAAVGLVAFPAIVRSASNVMRGFLPGMLAPATNIGLTNLQEVTHDGATYLYVIWKFGYYADRNPTALLVKISE